MHRKDRARLHRLRADGYFKPSNKIGKAVLTLVKQEATTFGPRPAWVTAFLEMHGTAASEDRWEVKSYDLEGQNVVETACASTSLYVLLGRDDDEYVGNSNALVLANWLRFGLSAKGKKVAEASDVSQAYASRIRCLWENEIRLLLADAQTIGITGEELYCAVTTPEYFPQYLIERIRNLRSARDALKATPTEGEYQAAIKEAWFDYRVNMGRKGVAPDEFEIMPPRWFVKRLT